MYRRGEHVLLYLHSDYLMLLAKSGKIFHCLVFTPTFALVSAGVSSIIISLLCEHIPEFHEQIMIGKLYTQSVLYKAPQRHIKLNISSMTQLSMKCYITKEEIYKFLENPSYLLLGFSDTFRADSITIIPSWSWSLPGLRSSPVFVSLHNLVVLLVWTTRLGSSDFEWHALFVWKVCKRGY